MGLVTVTSIWSMGKTPLSMPTTMRGKFVSGKTETGMVSARYAPTAIRVRMTKMMGLPWRAVQCGASGWVTGSLIDRKSTRLNSSHLGMSYAVFCLKKTTDTRCPLPIASLVAAATVHDAGKLAEENQKILGGETNASRLPVPHADAGSLFF